jgi:hypothetical protein
MHLSGHATKRALFGLATGIDSGCALPSDDGLTLTVAKFSQPRRLSASINVRASLSLAASVAPAPVSTAASVSTAAIPAVIANVTAAAGASIGISSAASEFLCERKPQKDAEDDRNLERRGEIEMQRAIIERPLIRYEGRSRLLRAMFDVGYFPPNTPPVE